MAEERRRDKGVDRDEPVGSPVVRGDADVTGEHAKDAVSFDPDDPESVAFAAETVQGFASDETHDENQLYILRGAAACAALVRGVGSYTAAVERADGNVTVSFVRKWARVHDLPIAIRRHVAMGDIAPSAAKHIARVGGAARFDLAWATLDNDLTVREVRRVASAVNDGAPVAEALDAIGASPGELTVALDADTYRELRRVAANEKTTPDAIIERAFESYRQDRNR